MGDFSNFTDLPSLFPKVRCLGKAKLYKLILLAILMGRGAGTWKLCLTQKLELLANICALWIVVGFVKYEAFV